jgi:hypothetical protein
MKIWRKIAAISLVALIPAAVVSAGAKPDDLTPSDAEMVVQVNVRSLLQTPLVKKHALESLKALLKRNGEVRQLLNAAGLDPLKDIDTISVSGSGLPVAGGKAKMLVVVRGTFAPEKARAAAADYAKKHPGHIKSVKVGDLPMWEIQSDSKAAYAAFAGNNTLIMTATKEETAAVVHRAGQTPQTPSAAMQSALAHLKGTESIWMAMVATEEIKQLLKGDDQAKDIAAAVQSITGSLELSEDVQLGFVIHTKSPEAAAQIKGKLDELMPLLAFLGAGKDKSGQVAKEVIDSIKLKTEKNDVSVGLRITDAQITKAGKKTR